MGQMRGGPLSRWSSDRRRDSEHGQILILFAFVLIALLLVSALAVDYGGWLLARRSFQNAADQGALAAAAQLTNPIIDDCPNRAAGTTKGQCAREAAWASVKASLGLTALDPVVRAALGGSAPYLEKGYRVFVASPPFDANATCSSAPTCAALFPACVSPTFRSDSCPYPGSVSNSHTAFVRVDRNESANVGRVVRQAGQDVSAWATAGRIPQSYAFVGLCYPTAPQRIGSDCHNGSQEDLTINGSGSSVVIQSGDLGVNTWVKTAGNGAAVALSPDSAAYMGQFSTCWGNVNSCQLVSWIDPPGTRGGARNAIPLGPQLKDPQYPAPPIDTTSVPWQCGGSGAISFAGSTAGVAVVERGAQFELASYVQPRPDPNVGLASTTKTGGTITDASFGGNLSGALVSITLTNNTPVTSNGPGGTGANGSYSFTLTDGTQYVITVSKLNYYTQTRTVTWPVTVANRDFALVAVTGTLSGTVTSSLAPFGPIQNATVVVGGVSTTTNAAGFYSIPNVSAGNNQTITVSAAGYATVNSTFNMPAGGPATKNIAMGPTGSISGTVTDSVSSAALVGATVQALQGATVVQTTTTIAGGTYSLSSLPAGSYTVTASMSGYTTGTINNVMVTAGTNTPNKNFALAPTGGFIDGTVVDDTTNLPISGAAITLSPALASATSDASGHYHISVLAGRYDVTASKFGYTDGVVSNVRVNAGQTVSPPVDFRLWPSVCDSHNHGSWECANPSCPNVTGSGGSVTCPTFNDGNHIRPGTYDTIHIPSGQCAYIDPVPAGGLPSGQLAGVVHVKSALNVDSGAWLFGDGVTIVLEPGAKVTVGGGFVLNYSTTAQPLVFTTKNDGNDYGYAAWAVDIKTKAAQQPWLNCGSLPQPTYKTSCFSASVLGITWYLLGTPPNNNANSRFSMSAGTGFLFKGILYAPNDNLGLNAQPNQASAGQVIGWTITYGGSATIFHRYNGIQVDGPPYLIEPFLGQ
jgi:hypothetical protein